MKNINFILCVLALIAGSCKPKTTFANPMTLSQADTLHTAQQELTEEEFNSNPLVSAEDVTRIAPVIKKWTDFYNINFSQARLVYVDTTCFNCPPTLETNGIYFRGEKIGEVEDTDKRIDVDYSPDKQRYVDLNVLWGYEEKDGEYEFLGWDDCQEIYLIDRTQKHENMILFLGSSACADAVFWKSNDIFMIVGYSMNSYNFVYVFDIAKQTRSLYNIISDKEDDYPEYMNKVYWKEKGIIVK